MGPRGALTPVSEPAATTGGMPRRHLLRGAAATVLAGTAGALVAGCDGARVPAAAGAATSSAAAAIDLPPGLPVQWVDAELARGHRLRGKAGSLPPPAVQRRAGVLVVGAGVAGLAAARSSLRAGQADVQVLELASQPGGNSRGHQLAGMACPLGAHYLPLPEPPAHEVLAFLHEEGLLRHELGRTVAEERHLCHSPQERLFIDGAWAEGLLPPADPSSRTQAQYRAFAAQVRQAQAQGFALPSLRAAWTADHAALDAQTFAAWLARQGLDDERLLWYLDYCCRDDYGAGLQQVSAWAGLHYFASRHGFAAAGEATDAGEPVFTWPEGNAALVQRLAAPLRDRLHTGRTVLRVEEARHGVQVLAWDEAAQHLEAWQAQRVLLAVPVFVAARLWAQPPAALQQAAAQLQYAPWLVANLHLDRPLLDRPGVPPAWDSVAYGGGGLGWVDAMHQSLRTQPGPTVMTAYRSLLPAERGALLQLAAADGARFALQEMLAVHPDLPRRLRQVALQRWGHGMAIPAPGVRSSVQAGALAALRQLRGRVRLAHSDLTGSSVFEEAYTLGWQAGRAAA